MEQDADLKSRIQNVADKISLSNSSKSASTSRVISSSIGSETPVGVLTEIREGQARVLDEMKNILAMQQEIEARTQERHREMCTILLGLVEAGGTHRSAAAKALGPARSIAEPAQKSQFYYGPSAITNGKYLFACIFLHLDRMLKAHPRFKKIEDTDKTLFTIKEWYNMCSYALDGDKESKAGLRIPKPTDEDFISAAGIVASTLPGRKPECDTSHISLLLSQCSEMMNTVEWLRVALIKCTGVLSPERTCRFKLIQHPFINADSVLLVSDTPTLRMPNKYMHQDVMAMKATQKKEYMELVLGSSMKAVDAISAVRLKV